jgi:hypothetical protein
MQDEARSLEIFRYRDLLFQNGKLNETIQRLNDEKENLEVELKLYKDSLDRIFWD